MCVNNDGLCYMCGGAYPGAPEGFAQEVQALPPSALADMVACLVLDVTAHEKQEVLEQLDVAEARSDGFVFIMAFDFVAFWIASITETHQRGARWWWTLLPLIGLAAWLAEREGAT